MAHFAQIDQTSTVLRVVVIDNAELVDADGNESEVTGIDFCKSLYGTETTWIQTSYNGNIRKNYAGIGYAYDADRDAFIPPQPYPSWLLNEESCLWEAPVLYPNDGERYTWDEDTQAWVPSEV